MKILKKITAVCILALSGLMMDACQPEAVKPLGEAFNRVQQLSGTWQIEKVEQIDTDAESKSFPRQIQRLDITNRIPGVAFTDFKITFNTDASGNPSTFATTKGSAIIDVLDAGTWAYNDPEFPSAIVLTKGDVQQQLDVASFANITSNKLILKLSRRLRTQKGFQEFLRYEYNLKRN
jgi:hypothetical protein